MQCVCGWYAANSFPTSCFSKTFHLDNGSDVAVFRRGLVDLGRVPGSCL